MTAPRSAWLPGSPVLCVGEILWDALPQGLLLGGAPFNVACHLHQMGVPVQFASCVGNDELGREIVHRVRERGLSTHLIQTHRDLPTGFVRVSLDHRGSPGFVIHAPSAWDAVEADPSLVEAASRCSAVVYGTLAWRNPQTRETIRRLLAAAPVAALDVNLRAPFDTRDVVLEAARAADIIKLSDSELDCLSSWLGIVGTVEERTRSLASHLAISTVCVTAGADGAMLLRDGEWLAVPGIPIRVVDAVGAGDSFFAALLAGLIQESDPHETLMRANAIGAYVATQPGATPPLTEELLRPPYPSIA